MAGEDGEGIFPWDAEGWDCPKPDEATSEKLECRS
jgi:hypothetical protein